MTDTTTPKQTITIKKYANRRLYNTATSSYVTLEDLSAMVKEGIEFNVYDAKTSEDITRSVLTQIIVEEEGKSGQQNLLPIGFLRQLIGFYGDNMQWMVPKYLEHSMEMFTQNQEQVENYFQSTFGNMFPFGTTLEEMGKQNIAMFERAMRMFSTFPGDDSDMTSGCACTSSSPSSSCDNSTDTSTSTSSCCCGTKTSDTSKTPSFDTANTTSNDMTTTTTDSDTNTNVTPIPAAMHNTADTIPTPNVKNATSNTSSQADDMQQKIANLQRQLADLAKSRA